MINIGGDINEVYVGSTKIAQAYVGTQLVYEAGEEDIYTYLRKQGCIAWFPLAYEGDFTDVIGGLTLTNVVDSRITWDTDKGMYLVSCYVQNPAATISLGRSVFFTQGNTYGVMAQTELKSGNGQLVTVVVNDRYAGNGALEYSETLAWHATFIYNKGYDYRYRYSEDSISDNGNRADFNKNFSAVGLGRNARYTSNGTVYVRDLLLFNQLVPFETYQIIKTKLEDSRNN